MEIAIDTSTGLVGIALSDMGELIDEEVWTAGRNHTVELMPAVLGLLSRHGSSASDLSAIFVAIGPGSFSALRVGISAAKGLALGTGSLLVGVGTMWIEAAPFEDEQLPLRPILDAARGELSVGHFVSSPSGLEELASPALMTVEGLVSDAASPTFFCGEHLPVVRETLATALGDRARFPETTRVERRPRYLSAIGWRRLQNPKVANLGVAPIYARPPSISKPNLAKAARR